MKIKKGKNRHYKGLFFSSANQFSQPSDISLFRPSICHNISNNQTHHATISYFLDILFVEVIRHNYRDRFLPQSIITREIVKKNIPDHFFPSLSLSDLLISTSMRYILMVFSVYIFFPLLIVVYKKPIRYMQIFFPLNL